MKFLIGADPELFVKKDGKFVSGYGLIRGDKENPFPVKNGAVQVDGMALEFNIDPAANKKEFVYNIQSVMDQLKAMVPEYNVVAKPTARFTEKYMKAQPKKALELGCDPDYNAWQEGAVNERPDQDLPMRTGAGHIHIGWTQVDDPCNPYHIADCIEIVKQLDYYLGLASLFLDKDKGRREMYGKAGAFRPKPYGVEYRVLSNFWLKTPELVSWVYDTTIRALNDLLEGNSADKKKGRYNTDAAWSINNSCKGQARRTLALCGLEVPDV